MSGIYIPGVKMPECCAECFCMEEEDLFCRITKRSVGGEPGLYPWNPLPDNCPLIPVPDHGRLVDGDKIVKENQDGHGRYISQFAAVIGEAVEGAPTVIPADEEETE